MRLLIAILLSVAAGLSHAAPATPQVAASIKPLHSLAASITRGVAQPALLLDSTTDPHHFSLRPSQRRLIAEADLIVWVGPQLEAGLGKAIQSSKARKLTILQTALPVKLAARLHAHGESNQLDPHVWLSPDNAAFILQQIADALIAIDPANRRLYLNNLDDALTRVTEITAEIEISLALPQKNYIAFHDAYQYFEHRFGLQLAGAIKHSDASQSGARQLSKLHHMVELQHVNCIVYDSGHKPAILNNFPLSGKTRVQRIDILGSELVAGENLWFDLMQQAARGFHQCLQ